MKKIFSDNKQKIHLSSVDFLERLIFHSFTDNISDSLIEGIWKNMLIIRTCDIARERFGCSYLHRVSDLPLSIFENSLEESWKYENIVDLIWIV